MTQTTEETPVRVGFFLIPDFPMLAFSAAIGQALDDAVANQFAGQATPQQVIDQIVKASKQK